MVGNHFTPLVVLIFIGGPYLTWRFFKLNWLMPCVVVQILFGVLLGSSAFAEVAPSLQRELLSSPAKSQINGIGSMAVFFFALITGLHFEISYYKGRLKRFLCIGFSSIAIPFLIAALATLLILASYPEMNRDNLPATPYVLAMGIALSVTALPVLAAILGELGLNKHPIGSWALGLAAFNDALLWLMISGLLGAYGRNEETPMLWRVMLVVIYFGFMFGFLGPLLQRIADRTDARPSNETILIMIAVLTAISATAAEMLGIHYLLGAFVAGSVLPKPVKEITLKNIEGFVVVFLLPFFFISSGMRAQIELHNSGFASSVVIVTAAAIFGKYLGTTLPARMLMFSWRDSLLLGTLMQAKGMMELAVISILTDSGFLPVTMYSVLLLMAMITTVFAFVQSRLIVDAFNE